MKRLFVLAMGLATGGLGAQEPEDEAFDRWYVGGTGTIVLPQGGADMHRLGGAAMHLGYYATPAFALDVEAAWMENKTGLSAKALWHLQGFAWWGMMFGYERLDPFLSVGAKGWLNPGEVGPVAGLGSLYYLTDSWALRAEADVTLGLESAVETVYTLSVGVQYSF
ncbi:MAG: hypothetical protein ACI4R9_06940 [Kiritimatiellia bacterium]